MNQVPVIATCNEGANVIPDRNWRSTLTVSEQHAIIFHLVSALRAVSSNVSLEHLVAIVNAFEKHAYEKANSKMEYINICNSKLMHIKGNAIVKQRSLQTQNQQQTMQFLPQIQHQQIISGQPKTFEQPQTSGMVSQATFARSAPQQSQQAIDSHSQFQQPSAFLNPQIAFQQKQVLMRQASANPHFSAQSLQSANCSVNQQACAVNSVPDQIKHSSHFASQQKASQIQQILNQLRIQNNQQQYPQYMTHQAHPSQSSDKHQKPLNQQKMHMLSQADVYQQCSDGSLLNPSNMNLQKLVALNQAIQSQKQNKQLLHSQLQAKQLFYNQALQGFLSQMQVPSQVMNPHVQKRVVQTTGSSTPQQEFKKYLDPHLNPCNYLIPQSILAQLPELPSNVSTWTQVADLLRNQRLSPEQMARVHELFYQHALYLQLHYQQIQQIPNQSVNQFQPQPMSQSHSKLGSQIQQQQMRQSPIQLQKPANVISSEFISPEWSSEVPNFPSYSHGFVPNTNISLNNQVSSKSSFQSIDQLLTMVQNDNSFDVKKRAKTPTRVKKKEDIKSIREQQSTSQVSNLMSSLIPNQAQVMQFKQDFPQSQGDSSIIQKILMCGGKEANIQMIVRLKQIYNEVERNGVRIIPLNDLTSVQKQQVCELVVEMNQMYHRIDMLLPLFMTLNWNESAVKQLLQMKLIYKSQFDALSQGIYLCYPSQLIKIKKMISEYFKFVKINVHAIQKHIENGKSLPDKIPINLSEIDFSITNFQCISVDEVFTQMSNEIPLELLKTDLNNIKSDDIKVSCLKENNFDISVNFNEINIRPEENNVASSEKINSQVLDLSNESFGSQGKSKVVDDSANYAFLNTSDALEANDVNTILSMDKALLFSEKEHVDIMSNRFGSEVISNLVAKIPQSLTNVAPDQSSRKDQNEFIGVFNTEDGKLSSGYAIDSPNNEKVSCSLLEAEFSPMISVLEAEKILNDVDFEQCFDLTLNDKDYENSISDFDKLQESNFGSALSTNEIKMENTFDELRWDFGGVSNIGPFKIKDFYASNNENIWSEELKTKDLSTLGLGIVANVY